MSLPLRDEIDETPEGGFDGLKVVVDIGVIEFDGV